MHVDQGTVTTEGAELYYETCGEGPPVLLIQGGLSETGATQQLATELAQQHQVISYDRRGLSRSTVTRDPQPLTMATHADDAAALLAALTSEPARVVGPSIGAVIGLHLTARHPDQVALLVAHEPPMASLVRDPDQEAGLDEVAELARDDVGAAIRRFVALGGSREGTQEPGAGPAPPVGNVEANLRRFFTYDFPAVRTAALDLDQLTGPARPPVIVTGGEESRGQWEYRCAQQLAAELDCKLVETPGGHNGLVSHPWATADVLRRLFTESIG
ncbi:alpha/beta hydrolase [Saccharopolyspora endophytica]|uniref:Alpha/beta hydrolase n=1 Tax=Saccharopolyspora endophytica TaxID=543886 RepID=A0ABS5DMJ6_9PSEU|nr:alpha/beta hydrolase [Saccharopolyspora endophytica]